MNSNVSLNKSHLSFTALRPQNKWFFGVYNFYKKSDYRVLQIHFSVCFLYVNSVPLLPYLFFCCGKDPFYPFYFFKFNPVMGRKEERNFTFWMSYFFILLVTVIPSFIGSLWTMNAVVYTKSYIVSSCGVFFSPQWERLLWFKQIIMSFHWE